MILFCIVMGQCSVLICKCIWYKTNKWGVCRGTNYTIRRYISDKLVDTNWCYSGNVPYEAIFRFSAFYSHFWIISVSQPLHNTELHIFVWMICWAKMYWDRCNNFFYDFWHLLCAHKSVFWIVCLFHLCVVVCWKMNDRLSALLNKLIIWLILPASF